MKPRIAYFVFLACAAGVAQDARPDPEITAKDLLGHVQRLSSDAWEGRGTGSAGERQATKYIAAHFKRLGFAAAGENGTWFQDVSMPGGVKLGKCTVNLLDDKQTALDLNKEFRPFSASASGTVEGEVVFAGYGITAPGMGYDDYKDLDVSGKIVVIFRHTPRGPQWQGGRARQLHAPFTAKLARAVKGGAIGLIIVNDPANFPSAVPPGDGRRRRTRPDVVHRGGVGAVQGPVVPFAHMTLAAARRVFPALLGATPEELEQAIHAGAAAAPASRAGRVRLRMALEVEQLTLVGRNVVGLLKAEGKPAMDEIIVVGAHHDHLGRGMAGSLERDPKKRTTIHNGADDNASGTSGVLEIAEYMAARRSHLRRSILFMTFTGEERGLVGSRYFVNHPTVPLEKIVAMINMDMIGRLEGRKLFIGGVKTSPVFLPLIERINTTIKLPIQPGAGGRAPSDNTSFYNKGKPVLFFFTGMHGDYHRPSDDWDKIDAASMERVARIAGGVVDELARSGTPIPFTKADSGGSGPPRAVLGISIGAAEGGVGIAGVVDGGPAAKAGLKAGDVIVSIGAAKVADFRSLRMAMRRLNIGDKLKVKVLRDGQTLEFEVTLGSG